VSLQVAILKVLSGHPHGRATINDMNSDLGILVGCKDWNGRMKRLAARAPDLDIFGQELVVRDVSGWQLTEAGRAALALMEAAAPPELPAGAGDLPPSHIAATETVSPSNVVDLDWVRRQRRAPPMASRSA
jgi:hypothetical protein